MSDKGTYQDIMRRPRVSLEDRQEAIEQDLIDGAYIDHAEIWDNGPAQKAAEDLLKKIISGDVKIAEIVSFQNLARYEIEKLARQRAEES